MGKHLVLVGGGHAHMVTLANLNQFVEKGHRVTVIGPSEYHYYSGMGPGMVGGSYTPEEIRFATRIVVEARGGRFIKGRAVRIDPDRKVLYLESGAAVTYDLLSCNVGSYVPYSAVQAHSEDLFYVKPIETLIEAKMRIIEKLSMDSLRRIIIVGGGPSSAEMAGNIRQLVSGHISQSKPGMKMPDITVLAGRGFMSRFPDKIRKMVKRQLRNRGIAIRENGYVVKIEGNFLVLESGEKIESDIILMAVGVKPPDIFAKSGVETGPDNGMAVNSFLQSISHPSIFGGGDCIYFRDRPLDKVGVYAVRENHVLFNNLMAYLDESRLMPFDPGGEYLLIFNLGDEYGVLKKRWFSLEGRAAFVIKDYIDRKFMNRFQSLEG